MSFKIATFNANSIRSRLEIIRDWLNANQPDVLCIQETKVQDHDFPLEPLQECGYHVEFIGQKSYNGVATLSKLAPEKVVKSIGGSLEDPEQARFIHATFGDLEVVNTYVPQGFEPGSDKFAYKLAWLARLKEYFEENFTADSKLIWLGDINVAPEPRDVYDPEKLAGHCGFHPDEHVALKNVTSFGFVDVFRKHCNEDGQFTFWDYRMRGSLSRNNGWRIDHIYATRSLAEKSTAAYVDIEPRKLEKPSDHTFLIAEFDT